MALALLVFFTAAAALDFLALLYQATVRAEEVAEAMPSKLFLALVRVERVMGLPALLARAAAEAMPVVVVQAVEQVAMAFFKLFISLRHYNEFFI
jgi:hypothetical protein